MKTEKNLNFSQANGHAPIPQPLALRKLPKSVRNLLWTYIHENTYHGVYNPIDFYPWSTILYDFHTQFLRKPVDEFINDFQENFSQVERIVMKRKFNEVFDFLQFVLRHDLAPEGAFDAIKGVLEDCMCAYAVVVIEDGPTIVPISSPEQGEAIQESFKTLASSPFEGARAHLRKSAERINAKEYADSVRESIHCGGISSSVFE